MAGAGSGTIPFFSLRTGSDEWETPIGGGSNSIGDLNVPPVNGGGSNSIGDLNHPPSSEVQKMMRELEQLREEKQRREARRKRRIETTRGTDSDSSDDEFECVINGGPSKASLEAATNLEIGLNLGAHVDPNTGPSRPKKSRNEEWRIKIEKMIEECRQTVPREIAARIARGAGESPLTDDILSATKPKRFVVPAFQKYDGTTDPVDHIRGYKQAMRIETSDEKLMCKIFPTSLTGSAAKWFQDLKPRSISSLDELTRVFVSQYFCSREQKKDIAALFGTKQNIGEKIGKFFERFKAEMRGISCEPQYAAIAFREGLLPGTTLFKNLIRNPPKDMDDVLTQVEGEIRLERAKEA